MVNSIRKLDDKTLAKEVQEQIYLGLPGLVTEVQEICQKICIPDMCTEDVTKDEF